MFLFGHPAGGPPAGGAGAGGGGVGGGLGAGGGTGPPVSTASSTSLSAPPNMLTSAKSNPGKPEVDMPASDLVNGPAFEAVERELRHRQNQTHE
jgi:hypothetical protein